MRKVVLLVRPVVFAALFSAVAAVAQSGAATPAAPVPPAIRTAQTIFISNGGGDSGGFPELGDGSQNRAYDQFYAALTTTGHYRLMDDPSEADLVVELELLPPSWEPGTDIRMFKSTLRLVIIDRRTHFALWTLTEKFELSKKEKDRDHNFEQAITALTAQFEQLTGKQATAH